MSTYTQDITHLIGKINTNLPDNDTQAITAARIRDAMGAVAYNYDLYVLKSQLNQELGSYVLKTDLDTAGYVTQSQLSESSYVTASQLEGLVTDQELQEGMQSVHDDAYAYVVDKISDIPVIDPSIYVSKTELSAMGYITENDLPDMSTYVSQDDLQSALEPYVTESQLTSMSYATKTYVADYVAEHAPMPDLSAYVTKTELSEAGYLTTVPSEYVTESQLQSTLTAYITDAELSSMGYITSSALGDYVTETELSQAGYLTSIPSEYVTQSQLSANSYVTETNMLQAMEYYASSYYVSKEALSQASYVTQNELSNMGYITTIPEEYVTDTELSNMGYVTQTDLSAMSYATTSDLSSKQDTLVSGTNIKTINGETLLGEGDITIQSGAEPDYSNVLTFTAEQANSSVSLNRIGSDTSLVNAVLQYSTDNGETWNDYTLGTSLALAAIGDTVKLKGTNATLASDGSNYHKFIMTGKISASGDITSLFNETGGDIPMPAYGCYYLFYLCASLTTAPKLPSTTLATSCYGSMFYGCTRLTTAPELPATTLETACYSGMFWSCTSLTKAPELPAVTLKSQCYQNMFNSCTSLTTAPVLPATSLSVQCYSGMFYKCSSLNYIKAMFTSSPATYQTQNWVYNVAANGVFVKNSTATWTDTGVNAVPTGWTVYKTVALDTDDVPESYVEDNGKILQVVNGLWTKVTGGGGDMSAYVTKTELSSMGYLTSVPSEYITETELSAMGYLTAVPSEYITETELSSMGYATQQLVNDTATMMQTVLEDANIINVDPGTGTVTTNEMATETYVADYVASYAPTPDLSAYVTKTELSAMSYATTSDLSSKQDTLVSGTNIKTINNESLLGSGDITISGGGDENEEHVLTFVPCAQYYGSAYKIGLYRQGSDKTNLPDAVIQYKLDTSDWADYTIGTELTVGKQVKFRGTNDFLGYSSSNYHYFYSQQNFMVYGDISSLCNKYGGSLAKQYDYQFYGLFKGFSGLQVKYDKNGESNLNLPVVHASQNNWRYAGSYMFANMFENCTGLRTMPHFNVESVITANKVVNSTTATGICYQMFKGCTSLTDVDISSLYNSTQNGATEMFKGCTGLTHVKMRIGGNFYNTLRMFSGCTGLTQFEFYTSAWNSVANNPLNNLNMFENVNTTGQFYISKDDTRTDYASYLPANWTVIQVDDDLQECLPLTSYSDNGKGLQVVNGAWQKVSGLLTSANLIYDSTTNTLTINV